MSTSYHTPYTTATKFSPAEMNAPLGELDAGILALSSLVPNKTLTVTAGEALAIGNPFYFSTASRAMKANSTTICNGIMLSSAASSASGTGQVRGTYYSTGSTWGAGKLLYVTSAAALSTARAANSPPIGFTISSSAVILSPTNLRRQTALTAASTLALSTAAWGQNEVDVVNNIIARVGELADRLQQINILST